MKRLGMKLSAIIFGLLVIAAGILLFAFNANLLPAEYKPIIFSWQMLLIAVGFTALFSRHKWGFGIIAMLAGGFFLAKKLEVENLSFITDNVWSVLLVVAGIIIICKTIFFRKFVPGRNHAKHFHKGIECHKEWHKGKHASTWTSHRNEAGYISRDFVFSGSKEKLDIEDFKGGEISCVFGGTELDLTNSQLAEGVHTLQIDCVFGGVVLYIPTHWKVEIRQTRVFGAFEDKRPAPNFEVEENRVLIIEVSAVFGGGEIKYKNK